MKKKYTITLLFFSTFIFSASAQSIEWQNTIGGSGHERLHSIDQTGDGGYICGGYSTSNISGDKTENCLGGQDYWVVKLDSAGTIQWQNTIGGNYSDILYSLVPTSDGGYICGGLSSSSISGDKTENSLGGPDWWVVKLDAAGNIQWQNTIGGDSIDYLSSIAQTADGGYICGGQSMSNISGDKTENGLGDYDYWVLKLDASGNIQWQNTIGGDSSDFISSIAQTADGGYICGGYSDSDISLDKTENCFGNWDYWVVKLDAAGNIQWENTMGGNADDMLRSVIQTLDGGYICGGSSYSGISGEKTENSLGSEDFWVIKLDAAGNIQWQNTIGGSSVDALNSLTQNTDGEYICAGFSASNISGDKTENCWGNHDYWLVRLNPSGNILWQSTIGGSSIDYLHGIELTADGGIICGGRSISNISGLKTENCLGDYDYWVVKLSNDWNLITGNLFVDFNSNNLQDTLEFGLSWYRIDEVSTGRFTFSQQNGYYSLSVFDTGNFSVGTLPLTYYNNIPAQHTAYFPGFNYIDSLNDFAFQPTATVNDLCVSITPPSWFRPGFSSAYHIHYVNAGTTILTPTIIFRKNNFLNYLSSTISPSGITADSIVWNLPPLMPFQQGTISVTLQVNIGTPIGTPVVCYARIEPIIGDANPACNFGGWEPPLFVTAANDPNEIVVNRDTLSTNELASPPFLQYIIYFQNTGNDTAFTVEVENVLPPSLDASSMELIALSHAANVQYDPQTRNVKFRFNDILLPDSNVNEPQSHGYIHYRIKPVSSLVAGDTIQNHAAIYFDYNVPVLTNVALTQIVLISEAENEYADHSVLVYPNPAENELYITSYMLHGKRKINIYNHVGAIVFETETADSKSETDVSDFPAGIYFLTVTDETGNKVMTKFIKM